jgi:pyruvate dehydrogenase E2 component (dihydrolipoamide acetyltransferase)
MASQVLMPALSPTMTEGTLSRWLKKEGDMVSPGDVLAEIETDKATMEVEAIDEGRLGRILISEGTGNVAVNTPIAILVDEGETADAAPAAGPAKAPAPAPVAAITQSGPRIFASPLARRLARDAGLSLDTIKGSGPNGRILRADIEAVGSAAAAPRQAPPAVPQVPATTPKSSSAVAVTDAPHHAVANSSMRRAIARRLAQSVNTSPHFYVTVDIELDALLEFRGKLNKKSPSGEGAFKLSVNDMLIKAAALAHRKVPGVAVTFTEDAILHYDRIDISVAVAIPDGLITPIIRDADHKGLVAIHHEAADLFKRARDGKLRPEEYQGGAFSISNLGMFGVREFTAIINPPQAAILAVGAGQPRAVVRDGALAIANVMTCTLSSDHRAVDGALAARYLAALKSILEDPLELVL